MYITIASISLYYIKKLPQLELYQLFKYIETVY